MKVWIDLSNSPHPLLFAPIARRMRADGHEVLVTARDHAQTVDLARSQWTEVDVLGGPSPAGKWSKLKTLERRTTQLAIWARRRRPDVALSHNSYAQIVAAWVTGVPAVTAMDYEHQPANHLAFRLAHTVLLPKVLPDTTTRRQGAAESKVVRYPGLKEELYIGDFVADHEILAKLGLERRPRLVVVVRTPPSRAIYHPEENALFRPALRAICAQDGVGCVVLARFPEQIAAIEAMELPNCRLPREALDARSLMYAADAVIGAGGTMTREAALLGIPTWTLFAGRTPAVDTWLEKQGRLARLTDPGQLSDLQPRPSDPTAPDVLRQRGERILGVFAAATAAAQLAKPRPAPR